MEHFQTVQQIFTARLLRIPDYQRGYAWERKHWSDLLEDLELLEVGSEHYTGTLVLRHLDDVPSIMDEEGREYGVYDIVDGQQRLTTIVILLDAIRRELPESSPLAEGIKKTYIHTRDIHGQLQPKLKLNRDTHAFFAQSIIADRPGIEGPQIRSHHLLREAHGYLREYLHAQKGKEVDGVAWLIDLHKKITNGLKLTVYEIPQASEVGVIFEVMNNRGKPLSELEKVKNYLLYLVSKASAPGAGDLGERINDTWRTVFERLMESGASGPFNEDQLLRAHWITVYNHQPKSWSGNDSIKRRFSLKSYRAAPERLIADLDEYVTSLRDFSLAYCDILSPRRTGAFAEYRERPVQQELQRAAEKLARLDALATFLPVLGAARLTQRGDSDLYVRLLQLCERYAFRVYRLARRRANAGQTSLFKVGHDLYHARISPVDALASIATYLLHYSPAADFRSGFEAHPDWYNWSGIKYFLYEYEEHLAGGRPVQMPWERLARTDKNDSIEHILPQTPTDPYWTTRWSQEQIGNHLHDLGNMSLTFDNSAYGNRSFPEKRGRAGAGACYANSSMFMERQLVKYADWTTAECIARRAELVTWALQRWEVTEPATKAKNLANFLEEDDE